MISIQSLVLSHNNTEPNYYKILISQHYYRPTSTYK